MPIKKTTQTKNIAKGESFTFAFRRINEAIANEYYLEAITICESIISDRLLSNVSFHKKNSGNTKTSLGKLIESAKKIHPKPIQWKMKLIYWLHLMSGELQEISAFIVPQSRHQQNQLFQFLRFSNWRKVVQLEGKN